MTHAYRRYTAAGNTFLVMNTWEDPLSLSREEMRTLVERSCDYQSGAGADGVILINQPASPQTPLPAGRGAKNIPPLPAGRGAGGEVPQFRMDFYNPDGTTGMLCGNGSRCAALAANDFGFANKESGKVNFEVLGAVNTAAFLPNGDIRVFFQDPVDIRLSFPVPVEGRDITASYVDLGSQHVVTFFEELKRFGERDLEEVDVSHYGPLLRWHPEFAPKGTNANFVEVREDGEEKYLRIRTFERGVEGETLACGTGCMSSAIVARLTERILKMPIRLLTQSGEFVTVNFHTDGKHISNLSLEGPVVRGEDGTIRFDERSNSFEFAAP